MEVKDEFRGPRLERREVRKSIGINENTHRGHH